MAAVPNPSIVALLNEAKQNNGKLVSIVESLDNEFLTQGLAYKLQIPCNMMGTHPCNRDGYGLHDSAVHSLGSEICAVGFSCGATSHACCIEDNASRDIETFSMHLCNSSDLLADVQPGDIKFGSLSCSHTNAFLKALMNEVPCDIESLSENNRMSLDKCCRADQGLKEACERGLKWLVYRSQVAVLYPDFCGLVQQARNASLQRAESEVQLLLRIHEYAVAKTSTVGTIDWPAVAKQASNVTTMHDIPSLVAFVQRWSGGSHGLLLKELTFFHRNHVNSDRIIPAATFQALANLRLSAEQNGIPLFVIAVLKCQLTCPDNKVIQKLCKYITAGDIGSIATKKTKFALEAKNIMRQCRDVCVKI